MKPTISYIEQKFEEFNRKMFGGKLPKIPVLLSNARTFIGMCTFRKRRTLFGNVEYSDFKLRINSRIDLPESEIEDTIIHEMIHYFIAYHRLKDTSAHGQVFRSMMNDINERYNRNITISHKSTKEQKELLMDTRRKWHVIAIVHFHDGRTGIKVLPRIKERIANYYRNVGSSREIESIDLYFSDNPFFNRYPCSSAFNVIFADRQTIEQNISDAKRLVCKGTDICLLENN